MQSLREIRQLLEQAHLRANKRLGQCFLIDKNLMGKLLELAAAPGSSTVLEVGPGTGSLTEELLERFRRVVAVEIDRGLADLLRQRLAQRENLLLLNRDALSGKHEIAPEILSALGGRACLVSNLPYNVATPLVAECLLNSWRACRGEASACRFERLTFTVQREVADRLAAQAGSDAYGPISVLVSLLGRLQVGPVVPASAFWPRPKVASRILAIDFDPVAAAALADAQVLQAVLSASFGQRRKQLGAIARKMDGRSGRFACGAFLQALQRVGIDPSLRAEQVSADQFLALANVLAGGQL